MNQCYWSRCLVSVSEAILVSVNEPLRVHTLVTKPYQFISYSSWTRFISEEKEGESKEKKEVKENGETEEKSDKKDESKKEGEEKMETDEDSEKSDKKDSEKEVEKDKSKEKETEKKEGGDTGDDNDDDDDDIKRPKDDFDEKQRHQLKHRELFLSRQVVTVNPLWTAGRVCEGV